MREPPPDVEPAPAALTIERWLVGTVLVVILGVVVAAGAVWAGFMVWTTGNLLDGNLSSPLMDVSAATGGLLGAAAALRLTDAVLRQVPLKIVGYLVSGAVFGLALGLALAARLPIEGVAVVLLPAALFAVMARAAQR